MRLVPGHQHLPESLPRSRVTSTFVRVYQVQYRKLSTYWNVNLLVISRCSVKILFHSISGLCGERQKADKERKLFYWKILQDGIRVVFLFSFFFQVVHTNQCDQIWRNFATLAKLQKSLVILDEFIYQYLAKY